MSINDRYWSCVIGAWAWGDFILSSHAPGLQISNFKVQVLELRLVVMVSRPRAQILAWTPVVLRHRRKLPDSTGTSNTSSGQLPQFVSMRIPYLPAEAWNSRVQGSPGIFIYTFKFQFHRIRWGFWLMRVLVTFNIASLITQRCLNMLA